MTGVARDTHPNKKWLVLFNRECVEYVEDIPCGSVWLKWW